MMEHAEIRRKLAAYLDNAVSGEEKEEIKRHLGGCGNCRAALADLELTIERLRSLPQVEPPPWLAGKIMAKVREAAPKRGLWQRLFLPLHVKLPFEALALLFICVTGYYLARTVGPELPLTAPPPATREEVPAPATAPPQTSAPQTPLPEAPAPLTPAAPGAPAAVPQQKTVAPATTPFPPPAPAPALPAKPMPLPELQPADEEFEAGRGAALPPVREEKGAPRGMVQQKKAAEDQALPAGKAEVTLMVSDPAAAAGAIEQAVTRHGGRISGHSYSGESHFLLVRIETHRLPALLDRLGRIGTMPERPQTTAGGNEMVELAINIRRAE